MRLILIDWEQLGVPAAEDKRWQIQRRPAGWAGRDGRRGVFGAAICHWLLKDIRTIWMYGEFLTGGIILASAGAALCPALENSDALAVAPPLKFMSGRAAYWRFQKKNFVEEVFSYILNGFWVWLRVLIELIRPIQVWWNFSGWVKPPNRTKVCFYRWSEYEFIAGFLPLFIQRFCLRDNHLNFCCFYSFCCWQSSSWLTRFKWDKIPYWTLIRLT